MTVQSKHVAFTEDDDETGLEPAIPAATVVILREQASGPPQLLMVRRAAHMRFAAGAAVFPGGRVDDDDRVLAETLLQHADNSGEAAARIAAIRETLEETGLPIGIRHRDGDDLSADALGAMRHALLSEQPFSEVLDDHKGTLDPTGLVPFSRWRPNFKHERVFDTRFFLARSPAILPRLNVVESENSAIFWLSARDALAQGDGGQLRMIFPTRRNLERLAQYNSFAEAVESTERFPSRRITPFIEEHDGVQRLCIRDDCGYPVTSEVLTSAIRD